MRISFAHMGTSVIIAAHLFEGLGYEVVRPSRPTGETLSLGAQYSPEFACIPFKLVLGTYLETLQSNEVDIFVSGGGLGPCRAGYYGELHQRILHHMGYDPEMVFFFPPIKKPRDFFDKLRYLKGDNSWLKFLRVLRQTWEKIKVLDDIEIRAQELRPFEAERGSISRALRQSFQWIDEAVTVREIRQARSRGLQLLEQVPQAPDSDPPLKIGIIGEIYVQLEPSANFNLEERLGEMGVQVRRSIYLTNFARTDVASSGAKDIQKLAEPYLPEAVGGHGQNSIGETVLFAREGYDGIVQLAPFTCIPEIVAKSIMTDLSNRLNIPVLTIFIDEQTGAAGVETRLEAFVDLLKSKKNRKKIASQAG